MDRERSGWRVQRRHRLLGNALEFSRKTGKVLSQEASMDYLRHIGLDPALGSRRRRGWLFALGFGFAGAMSIVPAQAQQLCGGVLYPFPYTDVSAVGAPFCPGIMEAYVTGISKGTTPTTFSPNATVTRVQMTTFLQRSLDQGLTRASRRAALNQWWTPQNTNAMQMVTLTNVPAFCSADGEYIWTSTSNGEVVQVQANTGQVVGTWTGALQDKQLALAAGKIFVAGATIPGSLYVIDPTQPPGAVTTAASTLGGLAFGITFDGTNVWTANLGGSVSIIAPQSPYTVTTVSTGFTALEGILYDGAHVWVTEPSTGKLFKLDAAGNILQTVTVGTNPSYPAFDGTNIWVPNSADNSISVVQASTGNVVATIIQDGSNLLNGPASATFDGERILITNIPGNSVTVFKAADLSFIANVSTGASSTPARSCSDGINFWVPLEGPKSLLRF
jgi:hypothetical protein